MTPRRLTAAICLVAIVLLVMGAFSKRWLAGDLRSPEVNAALRIGLTGAKACMATAEITQCEDVSWSQMQSMSHGQMEGSSWMWLGRLTFVVSLLASAALAGLIVVALLDGRVLMPSPLPKVALWSSVAILPFMGGYYALTPSFFSSVAAGRGFAFAGLGAVAGIIAAFREGDDGMN